MPVTVNGLPCNMCGGAVRHHPNCSWRSVGQSTYLADDKPRITDGVPIVKPSYDPAERAIMIEEALMALRNACHKNSVDHGFWDEKEEEVAYQVWIDTRPWNFGEKVALIHSELSELFEAWRKNIVDSDKDIYIVNSNSAVPGEKRRLTAIEEEIADVIIRVMDLCGKLDINVGQVVLAKMGYNKGRPHMHGGRKC